MLAMDHIEAPLLAELELPASPTIVIVGAYKGDTARFLLAHHPDATIHAYDPQQWALAHCAFDSRVVTHPYGLGVGTREATMYEYETDACSFVPIEGSRNEHVGRMMDAVRELRRFGSIALMVCNIEGYEYFLLPYVQSIPITRLLVQFHRQSDMSEAYVRTRTMLRGHYKTEQDVGKNWTYYA